MISDQVKIGYMINEASYKLDEVEITESGHRVTGKGKLQRGNEKNRNGRNYLTQDLDREIHAPRQVELLSTGNMLGEAGHPLSKDLVRQQTIDPKNTCVRFLEFWMDGDYVMGKFQGTNNDLGNTFDADLRQGVKPAFSLRALGTVVATREGATVQNLKMITYDYVIYPSHPGAYTEGIVSESAGIWTPQSGFKLTDNMDATKTFMGSFTNEDVVNAIKLQSKNEAAIEFIKDRSHNFHLLKECFDMTNVDTVDMISARKIAITEAGKGTIVMDVEDYIANEIQNYF